MNNKFKDILKMNTKTVFNNKMEDIMKNTFKLTLLLSALAIPGAMVAMDPTGPEKPGKPVPTGYLSPEQKRKLQRQKAAVDAFKQYVGLKATLNADAPQEEFSFSDMLGTDPTKVKQKMQPGVATQAVSTADAANKKLRKLRKGYFSSRLTKGTQARLQKTAADNMEIAVRGSSKTIFSVSRVQASKKQLRTAVTSGKISKVTEALNALLEEYGKKTQLSEFNKTAITRYEKLASQVLANVLVPGVLTVCDLNVVPKELKKVIDGFRALRGETALYPASEKMAGLYDSKAVAMARKLANNK